MQQLTLRNDIKINFVMQGDKSGIPVIFLHGYVDSWRSYVGVLSEFSRTRCAVALDLRGHGDSDKPRRNYSIEDFMQDIIMFMDALGYKRADIVGHSMGSFIAQALAANYPEYVERLVLISSAPSARNNTLLKAVWPIVEALQDPIDRNFVADFQTPSVPLAKVIMDMIISESMKVPAHVWKAALSGLLEADHIAILHKIAAHTLILWGNKDEIFTRSEQDALLSQIRYSSLKEYDGGHALHWEKPKEIAADIKAFLI